MNSIQLLDKYKPLFYEQPQTRYYLITGGRGSGKSWTLSLFLLNLTYEEGHVILFTRWTLTSAFTLSPSPRVPTMVLLVQI